MPIQAPQWTDFLSCPVCCNEFDVALRSPISLGCGHTICKACLSNLHRKQCPFDQTVITIDIDSLPVNSALLQLVQQQPASNNPDQQQQPPAIIAHDADGACIVAHEHAGDYQASKRCIEELAVYLKPFANSGGNANGSNLLSRPMQRKLVTLINCQLVEDEGRTRAMRAARSLGDRTVAELILQHQNPQQLSANLWAAVRARGCQFLGPAMQEEVLKLVLLALEDGSALSRKVLVMFVVQRLESHFPQASKTSIGHVVQLLYRASCFKVSKREGNSSLMQLKEEFRTYETLRREHDAQIVQIATEAGLRIAPDQWSALLYGDIAHKSHMQSIIDKLQTPQSFAQSVQELVIALQRTGDPGKLSVLRPHLELLAAIDSSPESTTPGWRECSEALEAARQVVAGLVEFIHQHGCRKLQDPVHTQHSKYKISMCRDLTLKGSCPRETNCTFAHSYEELEKYRAKNRKILLRNKEQQLMRGDNNHSPSSHAGGEKQQQPQYATNAAINDEYYVTTNNNTAGSVANSTTTVVPLQRVGYDMHHHPHPHHHHHPGYANAAPHHHHGAVVAAPPPPPTPNGTYHHPSPHPHPQTMYATTTPTPAATYHHQHDTQTTTIYTPNLVYATTNGNQYVATDYATTSPSIAEVAGNKRSTWEQMMNKNQQLKTRGTIKSLAELHQRKQEVISQLEKVVGKNKATAILNTASNNARQESELLDSCSPTSPYSFFTSHINSGPQFVRSDSILADDDYVPYDAPCVSKYGPISRMQQQQQQQQQQQKESMTTIGAGTPSYIDATQMVRRPVSAASPVTPWFYNQQAAMAAAAGCIPSPVTNLGDGYITIGSQQLYFRSMQDPSKELLAESQRVKLQLRHLEKQLNDLKLATQGVPALSEGERLTQELQLIEQGIQEKQKEACLNRIVSSLNPSMINYSMEEAMYEEDIANDMRELELRWQEELEEQDKRWSSEEDK